MSGCHVPLSMSEDIQILEKLGIDVLREKYKNELLKEMNYAKELINPNKESYRSIYCTYCGKSTIISA